ncbi:hypothetical protein [Streptomyces fractus]|uniref:hypothetical protein n=1 Tax=Streptomyces fractus TaxID=641806 RepID=UPI003CE84715
MTDKLRELAALLAEGGPDSARARLDEELRSAPPAETTTAEDGVMQAYGDRPDVDVIDD